MDSMQLLRQVLHWFEVEDPDDYRASGFPTFIWTHGPTVADSFYGFPMVDGMTPGLKVATEQYAHATVAPSDMAKVVESDEIAAMYADHVAGRLNRVSCRGVKSNACLYTQSPDADFVIGHCDLGERVTVMSACSGHGFKHSAALGELVADHLTAGAPIPDAFAPDRLGLRPWR
jgi:sarcosine oxidase